jgi:heme/copper-type cytochrome/quinol oxidase subunit 3
MSSLITRSMQASSAAAVEGVERRRLTVPSGWMGMLLLVATEATLFGTLIASYFYLRFQAPAWPPRGIDEPSVTLPLVLTGVLVCTSVAMARAAGAARAGSVGRARAMLLVALAVQAGYLAVQIVLFAGDLDKFSPRDTTYGSIYFTLLAVHHAHVLVGLLLDGWLLARLTGGLTSYRVVGVRAVAIYWHFVNTAAVLVVLTQLSPAL